MLEESGVDADALYHFTPLTVACSGIVMVEACRCLFVFFHPFTLGKERFLSFR